MICHRFLTHKNLRKRNFQSTFDDVIVKMRFSKVAVKYLNKHKKDRKWRINSAFGQNFGPSDRDRTCGLMVPNHPRSQLRHTRIYLIFCNFSICGILCGRCLIIT